MRKPEFVYVNYIETTPEKLWEALTSSAFSERYWWGTRVVSEWKVGSPVALEWRGKVTDDYVKRQVVSDPHSPRQFRVNGIVRNLDAWYDAFHITPDNKLYVAPQDRVHIW